jgi:hypothetical protein
MRVKFLTDATAPWGEAKKGQVVDVLPSVGKMLIKHGLAASTTEIPAGELEASEHREQTKGDGTVIVVVSPDEMRAMAEEDEPIAHKEQKIDSQAEGKGKSRRRRP